MKNNGYTTCEQSMWLDKDGYYKSNWLGIFYVKDREDKSWELLPIDSIPPHKFLSDYMLPAIPITEALNHMREKYGLYITVGLTESFLYKGEIIYRTPTTRNNGFPNVVKSFFDYKTVNGVLLTALDFMIEAVDKGEVKVIEERELSPVCDISNR